MTSKPTDDLLQRCRELLELNEKGESQQTALRALAATYDREITAHDRRAVAVSQTHLEAMRALLATTQQASTEIDELKAKLAFYEREREDQIRYLAAQSEEIIALLKQRIEQQLSDWNMPCAACSTPRACQYDGCRQDALTTQQPCGEVTDIELLNAMAPHLNDADGGYIVDYAAQSVVAAGRAAIAINAARTQGGES